MVVYFQRTCSDVITPGEEETIFFCISPFKNEETFLKPDQHKTPQVLSDRIVSDASSQTRYREGNGPSMISLDFRLGSVGKESYGCLADNNPMSSTRAFSIWEVI